MGNLDPNKVKAAILQGLATLEPRAATAKSDQVATAWNQLTGDATPKLLRGEITVDEWKASLGQFGGTLLRSVGNADQPAVANEVNKAAQLVEEAFDPPSPIGWLIFAGVAATGVAYWWHKRQEAQRTLPAATPETILGSRRKVRIPSAEPEEEEAEFEEI